MAKRKWLVKIPFEGTAVIPIERAEKPDTLWDPEISNKLHTGYFSEGMPQYFRNRGKIEEDPDGRSFESYKGDAERRYKRKARRERRLVRRASLAPVTVEVTKDGEIVDVKRLEDIMGSGFQYEWGKPYGPECDVIFDFSKVSPEVFDDVFKEAFVADEMLNLLVNTSIPWTDWGDQEGGPGYAKGRPSVTQGYVHATNIVKHSENKTITARLAWDIG